MAVQIQLVPTRDDHRADLIDSLSHADLAQPRPWHVQQVRPGRIGFARGYLCPRPVDQKAPQRDDDVGQAKLPRIKHAIEVVVVKDDATEITRG